MKKKFRVLSIILMAFAFFSCRNLIGDDGSDELIADNIGVKSSYLIQGTVSQEDFIDSASRTAFSAQPGGVITYKIKAECNGEIVTTEITNASTDFTLKIPHGGIWYVSAEGFSNSNPAKLILKSEETLLRISDESPMGYANLVLKPYVSESGIGNVSLEISLPDAGTSPRSINSVTIDDIDASIGITATVSGNQATISGSNVKSGSYTVGISFWGDLNNDGISDILYYHVTEVINVYDNLTTNTWVKHGDEPYFDNNGNFLIKDAMTQEFLLSTIYVDSSALNDNASGSWLEPYKTLDKAIERLGNSSSVKTIFVDGNFETSKNLNFSGGGNCDHDLAIKKNPRATSKPVIKTTTLSSFIVGGSYRIIIENIDFTGCGNDAGAVPTGTDDGSKAGAFLYFPSATGSAELTNCTISNYYSGKGGAICAGANSTVILTNVSITGCKATTGGAIYKAGGNLTIKGMTIIENNRRSDNSLNNIELAFSQNISISGTGTGSHIGITKDFASPGDNTVQFASDTTENISQKYFSDAGYIIGNRLGNGCIARTSGVIAAGIYEYVRFMADETEFYVGEGDFNITFSAKVGAGTDPVAIDNWSVKVTYAGMDITGQVTKTPAADKKSYTITFPDAFPEGNYYITVRGKYNGMNYSGTQIVKIEELAP